MRYADLLLSQGEILEALFALALCAVLVVRTVLVGLKPKPPTRTTSRFALEFFICVISILVVCFLAADALHSFVRVFDRSIMIVAGVAAVVGVLLFAAITFMARLGENLFSVRTRVLLEASYIGLLLGACCYFAARTDDVDQLPLEEKHLHSANLVQEHSEYLAITDSGTQVPLYDIDMRNQPQESIDYLKTEANTPVGAKVIPRADANINANCHGWVFTGGKHLLRGNGVDQILLDNGYTVQGEPAAGDVIVYRSDSGLVLHTGIVSGILLDGTCIIESKWGIAGRYLHQAEDQPYGLNYSFYRSERSGHLVTVIPRKELASYLASFSSEAVVENSAQSELQVAPTENSPSETDLSE